jgi:hypothetical protein
VESEFDGGARQPSQAKPSQAKPSQAKPSQAKPSQAIARIRDFQGGQNNFFPEDNSPEATTANP